MFLLSAAPSCCCSPRTNAMRTHEHPPTQTQCLDIYNTAATVLSTGLATGLGGPGAASASSQGAMERAYIAFPSVYLHYGEEENNGVLDVRLAFSRDGRRFRYIGGDRRAFVPRGFGAPVSLARLGLQPSLFDQPDDGVPARWDSGLTYMCVPLGCCQGATMVLSRRY